MGAVIPYHREAGGDYVNPSGCLDGKIGESCRVHWSATNIPPGWEILSNAKGRFLGFWTDNMCIPGYEFVGKTGGYDQHGYDPSANGGQHINNHEDHSPSGTGTGTSPPGGGSKGYVDGSFRHSLTDNRPRYVVACLIRRKD